MILFESPAIQIKWLQYTITIPTIAYCADITLFFKLITQLGKLIMVFITDAYTFIPTLEDFDKIIMCRIVTIFDKIVFGSNRYITNVLFINSKVHVSLSYGGC